jgi:hypothetical protein
MRMSACALGGCVNGAVVNFARQLPFGIASAMHKYAGYSRCVRIMRCSCTIQTLSLIGMRPFHSEQGSFGLTKFTSRAQLTQLAARSCDSRSIT